jgi:type II secretory ATPase GspE/PulE/Tfp pilus assembly ATPase PilB-like protein
MAQISMAIAGIKGEADIMAALSAVCVHQKNADKNDISAKLADAIVFYAVQEGASDVHFDPKGNLVNVRFRIDGILRTMLTYDKTEFTIVPRLRVKSGFPPQQAFSYTPEDGRFETRITQRNVQFRVSSFPTLSGDKLVVRILDIEKNAPTLQKLGFGDEVYKSLEKMIHSPNGILIVSGMTGCGKTTTLCGILRELNNPTVNIMTLEDPVEYELPGVMHSQINIKAGFTFAEGLRCMLRQDPNVFMVGEIRDRETAEIAMRAALTGHLIFTTVHAPTTTGVIHRLLDMGIEPYMLTSALSGVLAQRLVRKVCPDCAQPVDADLGSLNRLVEALDPGYAKDMTDIITKAGGKVMKAKGCTACRMTGYKGRIGVFELLQINNSMRSLICSKSKTDITELRQAALSTGMKTLLADALGKLAAGITTQDEIARTVNESN